MRQAVVARLQKHFIHVAPGPCFAARLYGLYEWVTARFVVSRGVGAWRAVAAPYVAAGQAESQPRLLAPLGGALHAQVALGCWCRACVGGMGTSVALRAAPVRLYHPLGHGVASRLLAVVVGMSSTSFMQGQTDAQLRTSATEAAEPATACRMKASRCTGEGGDWCCICDSTPATDLDR